MIKNLLILIIFALSIPLYAQKIKEYHIDIPTDSLWKNRFGYYDKWVYFELSNSITGKIINHQPADFGCGIWATASVTIVLTDKSDTIRVVDMCNMLRYKVGQIIKVIPRKKPSFGLYLPLPLFKEGYPLSSIYDLTILRTTWGEIVM